MTNLNFYDIIITEKGKEITKMKKMLYRIVFKDGRHTAWSSNYEFTVRTAEICGGTIESIEYEY